MGNAQSAAPGGRLRNSPVTTSSIPSESARRGRSSSSIAIPEEPTWELPPTRLDHQWLQARMDEMFDADILNKNIHLRDSVLSDGRPLFFDKNELLNSNDDSEAVADTIACLVFATHEPMRNTFLSRLRKKLSQFCREEDPFTTILAQRAHFLRSMHAAMVRAFPRQNQIGDASRDEDYTQLQSKGMELENLRKHGNTEDDQEQSLPSTVEVGIELLFTLMECLFEPQQHSLDVYQSTSFVHELHSYLSELPPLTFTRFPRLREQQSPIRAITNKDTPTEEHSMILNNEMPQLGLLTKLRTFLVQMTRRATIEEYSKNNSSIDSENHKLNARTQAVEALLHFACQRGQLEDFLLCVQVILSDFSYPHNKTLKEQAKQSMDRQYQDGDQSNTTKKSSVSRKQRSGSRTSATDLPSLRHGDHSGKRRKSDPSAKHTTGKRIPSSSTDSNSESSNSKRNKLLKSSSLRSTYDKERESAAFEYSQQIQNLNVASCLRQLTMVNHAEITVGDRSNQQEDHELWTCGQNSYGELSQGDTLTRKVPTMVATVVGKHAVQVAAGNEHTVVLLSNGTVYTAGYNDNGQCGHETVGKVGALAIVEGLRGKNIVQVHSYNGCEHTLCVTDEGDVYSFGYNYRGQLGHGNTDSQPVPTRIRSLGGLQRKVRLVSCSYYHSVVTTEQGDMFTFGRNDFGQLGVGDAIDRKEPCLVPTLSGGKHKFVSISCGQYHTILSVKGCSVYSCGKNDYGQLGLESSEPVRVPTKVSSLSRLVQSNRTDDGTEEDASSQKPIEFVQVRCGYYHTLVLTNTHKVWCFGRNDFGQLGLGHNTQRVFGPQFIEALESKNVTKITAGCYHTLAVTENGMMHVFGRNNHGQLGTGDTEERHLPHLVDTYAGKQIAMVAAGFYHTVVLTGGSEDTTSGESSDEMDPNPFASSVIAAVKRPVNSLATFSPQYAIASVSKSLQKVDHGTLTSGNNFESNLDTNYLDTEITNTLDDTAEFMEQESKDGDAEGFNSMLVLSELNDTDEIPPIEPLISTATRESSRTATHTTPSSKSTTNKACERKSGSFDLFPSSLGIEPLHVVLVILANLDRLGAGTAVAAPRYSITRKSSAASTQTQSCSVCGKSVSGLEKIREIGDKSNRLYCLEPTSKVIYILTGIIKLGAEFQTKSKEVPPKVKRDQDETTKKPSSQRSIPNTTKATRKNSTAQDSDSSSSRSRNLTEKQTATSTEKLNPKKVPGKRSKSRVVQQVPVKQPDENTITNNSTTEEPDDFVRYAWNYIVISSLRILRWNIAHLLSSGCGPVLQHAAATGCNVAGKDVQDLVTALKKLHQFVLSLIESPPTRDTKAAAVVQQEATEVLMVGLELFYPTQEQQVQLLAYLMAQASASTTPTSPLDGIETSSPRDILDDSASLLGKPIERWTPQTPRTKTRGGNVEAEGKLAIGTAGLHKILLGPLLRRLSDDTIVSTIVPYRSMCSTSTKAAASTEVVGSKQSSEDAATALLSRLLTSLMRQISSAVSQRKSDSGHDGNAEKVEWQEDPATPSLSQSGSFNSRRSSNDNRADATPTPVSGYLTLLLTLQKHLLSWAADDEMQLVQNAGKRHPVIAACRRNHDAYLEHSLIRLTGTVPTKRSIVGTTSGEQYGESTQAGMHRGVQCLVQYAEEVFRQCIREVNGVIEDAEKKAILAAESALAAANLVQSSQLDEDNTKQAASTCEDVRSEENSTATTVPTLNLGKGGRRDRKRRVHTSSASTQPTGSKPKLNSAALHISPSALEQLALSVVGGVLPSLVIGLSLYSYKPMLALKLLPCVAELYARLDLICSSLSSIVSADKRYKEHAGTPTSRTSSQSSKSSFSTEAKQRHKVVLPWILELEKMVSSLSGRLAAALVSGSNEAVDTEVLGAIANSTTTVTSVSHHSSQVQQDESETVGVSSQPAYEQQSQAHAQVTKDVTQVSLVLDMEPSDPEEQCIDLSATQQLSLSLLFSGGVEDHVLPQTDSLEKLVQAEIFLPLGDCNLSTTPLSPTTIGSPQRVQRARNTRTRSDPNKGVSFPTVDGTTSISRDTFDEDESTIALVPQSLPMNRSLSEGLPQPRPLLYQAAYKASVDDFYSCMVQNRSYAKLVVEKLRTSQAKVENSYAMALLQGRANGGIDAGALDAIERCTFGLLLKHTGFVVDAIVYGTILAREGKSGKTGTSGNNNVAPPARLVSLWSRGAKLRLQLLRYRAQSKSAPIVSRETTKPEAESKVGENNKQESSFAASCSVIQTHLCFALLFKSINPIYFPHPADPIEPLRPSSATVHRKLDVEYRKSRPLRRWTRVKAVFWIAIRMKRLAQQGAWFETQVGESAATRLGWKRSRTQTHVRSPSVPSGGEPKWKTSNSPTTGLNNTNSERSVLRRFSSHSLTNHSSTSSADPALDETVAQEVILFAQSACANAFESLNPNKETLWKSCNIGDLFQLVVHNQYRARLRVAGFNAFRRLLATSILSSPRVDVLRSLAPALRATPVPSHAVQQGSKSLSESPGGESPLSARWRNAHYAGRLGGVGCELLSQVSSAFTQLYHDLASSLAKSLTSDNRNQVDPMYSSQEQLLLLDAWTLHISKSDLHLLANTDLLSTLQLAMDPDRTRRSSMYLFEQPSTTNQSHRKFWSSVSDSIGASDSNGIVIDQANEKRTGRKKSSGDPIQQFRETQAKEFSEAAWMLFRMLLVQALHDSKLEPIVEPLVDSLYSELQLSLGELVSARIQGNQNSGSEKCLMKPLEAVIGTDDTTASCDTQTKTNIVFLSDPYHFVTTKPGMVLPWSCFAPGSCSTDALLQPSADCSISLWLHINSRARTGSQTLLLRGNKHGDHYPLVLLRDQDSRLEVELGSLQTSYEQFISKEAIPADEWVHVVIVIEDVKVKLFVNGSISNHHCLTSQVPPLDNNEEHEIYIGKLSRQFEAYSRASLGFEGWVSMAQLHRRALSPIHVRIMCDKGLPDFNAVDDTHAFQLLALMQGLLGSDVGRQIFSRPAWIALNAKMLLHGTTRVQQAVIRSWREVLPLCHPDLVASTLLEVCSNGAAPTETAHLSDSELFVDMLLHQIGHGMWELSVDTKPGTWKDRFLFADNPSIVPGKPSKNKRGSARENSKTKNLAQCRTIDPSWETAWNKRELALELIGLVRLLQVSRNWHFIVTQRVQYHLEGMTDVVSSNTVPKEFLDLCFLQSAAAGLGTIALLGGYTDVVRVGGRVAISHADITATVVSIDRDSKTVLVVMSPKELELCANDEFQPLGDSNSKNRIKMKALRVDIEEVIAVHDVPSIFAKSHHPAFKESSETTVNETNDGVFSNCHCSKHPTSNEDSFEGSTCIHQVFCKFLRKVLDGYGSIQPQEAFLDIRNKATGSESGIFREALREQLRSRTMYIFSGALETRESSSEQQDCFMHHLFNAAGGETKSNKLWAIQQTLECATYKIQSQQPLVLSVFEHQVETMRSRARLLLPVHCGVLQQPFETHRQDPACSENGDAVIHDVEQKESNFERKLLDEGEQSNHSGVLVKKTSMIKLSTESETSIGNTTTISTTISLDTTETAIGSISKDLIKGDDLNGFGSVRDDFTPTAISPIGSHPHHSLTTMFAEDSYPGPQYENVCGVLGNRRDSGVKAAELFSASVCHSNGKNIEGVPARMTTLDSNGLQVLLVQHELALGIMYCRKAALALMQRWRQWPIDEFDSSALMPHSALPIVKLVKLLLFRGSHVSLSPILSREFYLSQSTVPVLPTLRPLLEPKHGSLAWFLERRPDAGPGLADCYPTAYPAEDSGLMTHQSVSMALTAPLSQLVRAEMLGSRKHQSFREAAGQLKLSHALLVSALRDLAGASGVVKDLKETMAVLHALDTTSQPVESFKHVTWGFRQMTNSDQHALSMPNIELSCWVLSLLIREGSELLSYKPVVSLFCNIIASSNLAIRTVAVITLAAVLRICISNQVAHIHWVLRRVPWSSLRALADQQLLTEREGKVQIGSRYLNALVELLSMHRECIKVSSKLQLNSKTPPSKLQVSNLNFKNLKNRSVEISWVWPESSISVGKVAQIKLSPQEQVSSPVRNSTKASSRAKKELSVVYPIDKALFDSLSANTLYTCTVTILDPLILKKLSQTTITGNEDEVEEEKEETNEFSDIGSKISNGKDESGYQVTEQDITSPTLCFLTEKAGTEFRFDKNFCGDNITITGNGSSVRYSGSEAWSMVLGSEGFVCGEHTWEVKLDVTNTAYMFIGVATHKVSLASFLGGDEHGWGYIGDRAVYHARNKLKGYGERFKQGDIIGVTLDMDRGSLSYSKNGRMMGVAVTGLTGCLYPAFAFYNKSQRITLLKTGFQSSKNSKEDGYRLLAGSPKLCTLSDLEHSADFLSSVLSRGNVDDGIIQAAFTRWNTKGLLKRYPTLLGFEADFDTSEEKCLPLGFKAGSRIQTPRGNATVIGERADRLWLHVDGDSGAWFVGSKEWNEGRSKYVAFGKQPSESSKIEVAPKLESKVANDLWDEEMKEDVTSCDSEYEGKVMCDESPLLALFKSMIRNSRWSYEADTMLIQSVSQYCNKTSTSPWNIQLDTFANEIVPTLIPALQNSKEIKCQELLHCDDTSKGEVQGLSNLAYARYTLLCVLNDHVFRLLPFVTLATSSYLAGKRECTVAIGDNLPQVEKFAQHLSLSQKLRSLIGVLLYPSKLRYAQQLLDNTGTVAKKPDDEYDYPEELATLVLNRPKANFAAQSTEPETRMNNSLFGQAFDELHFLDASQLRLSYTHPMDDGQSRTFKVKFDGEGADDYGGPYREAFSQIVSELSSTVTPFLDNTSKKASESQYMFNGGKEKQSRKECILPLLHPTPNAQHGVGNHRDRLIIKPSSSLAKGSGAHLLLEMYNFMGQLIGIALRSSININLNLSTTVWKLIVGETILPADLAHYDQSTYSMVSELEELSRTVSALEESKADSSYQTALTSLEAMCEELTWTTMLSDGVKVPLVPGGENVQVTRSNVLLYTSALVERRLRESEIGAYAIRDGIISIIPEQVLVLYTAQELEWLVCGNGDVDIDLLKTCTEYDDDVSPDEPHIQYLWTALKSFNSSQRQKFLRFVWARSRLPGSASEFSQKFKIQAPVSDGARETPDQYLPKAHTCFFSLNLPRYTCVEVMREKLLYAIENCIAMDADFRVTDSEMATSWGIGSSSTEQSSTDPVASSDAFDTVPAGGIVRARRQSFEASNARTMMAQSGSTSVVHGAGLPGYPSRSDVPMGDQGAPTGFDRAGLFDMTEGMGDSSMDAWRAGGVGDSYFTSDLSSLD